MQLWDATQGQQIEIERSHSENAIRISDLKEISEPPDHFLGMFVLFFCFWWRHLPKTGVQPFYVVVTVVLTFQRFSRVDVTPNPRLFGGDSIFPIVLPRELNYSGI